MDGNGGYDVQHYDLDLDLDLDLNLNLGYDPPSDTLTGIAAISAEATQNLVENLFGFAVYERGALALHMLRLEVGDATFFRILRNWAAKYKYGNVSTGEFTALAEKLSGRDIDALFEVWLYSGTKPPGHGS